MVFSGASWPPPLCATADTPPNPATPPPGLSTWRARLSGTWWNLNIAKNRYTETASRHDQTGLLVPSRTRTNTTLRTILTSRLSSQLRCCSRRTCLPSNPRRPVGLLAGPQPLCSSRQPGLTSVQHGLRGPHLHQVPRLANYSDVSTEEYSLIYRLPHIKILAVVSRLKLIQTGITVAILPPVYYFNFYGDLPLSLVGYTTGIAVLAGAMLYTASHFLRKVVGMMYLDSAQTTLKVSHLTFWGRRHNVFLPVSDVMTLGDTGDSLTETILKLKRHSNADTMYFSLSYGRIIDKQAFEKVFGSLKK
ncbi:hypothetical protein CRUP_019859 [Coryphaenoides rupestris]|nr:hypothetical protein CRUP_019859 [Coryphaenoides rupestris]